MLRNNHAVNLIDTYYSDDRLSAFGLIILCKTHYKPCDLANDILWHCDTQKITQEAHEISRF